MTKVRVVVVDDSSIFRMLVSTAFVDVPNVSIVGRCKNGREAIDAIREFHPDLVTMDVEMPEMDGLSALREIRKLARSEVAFAKVKVVMISSITKEGADSTVQALSEGALDCIPKPAEGDIDKNRGLLLEHLNRVVKMVQEAGGVRKLGGSEPIHPGLSPTALGFSNEASKNEATKLGINPRDIQKSEKPSVSDALYAPRKAANPVSGEIPVGKSQAAGGLSGIKPQGIGAAGSLAVKALSWPEAEALGIGISTGGPMALNSALPNLCSKTHLPIFIVQHMPAGFTASLAESLNRKCRHTVVEATEGQVVQGDYVYIAPGGKHMVLAVKEGKKVITLHDEAPENGCRPAVDVLFRSLAGIYGAKIVVAVMTGMGSDGAKSLGGLAKSGARIVAQDQVTSVVWGMPGSAVATGFVHEIAPLDGIADSMVGLAQRKN